MNLELPDHPLRTNILQYDTKASHTRIVDQQINKTKTCTIIRYLARQIDCPDIQGAMNDRGMEIAWNAASDTENLIVVGRIIIGQRPTKPP